MESARFSWQRWRFLLLTLLLCGWMLLLPHLGDRWVALLLMQLLFIQFVLVTLQTMPHGGVLGRLLVALWFLSLAGNALTLLPLADPADRVIRTIENLATVPLLALLAAGILRYVFARRQLDTDGIFATVAAYLLVAFAFTQVYLALVGWSPDSFSLPVAAAERTPQQLHSDLTYYSLVTLATVGYGDILPASSAARTLAVIEATVGQFYVAVIVAVFVGMYATERRNRSLAAGNGGDPG